MDLIEKNTKIRVQANIEDNQFYSVEEMFDQIDKKFINFYGEYGRNIVNTRRKEWSQDDLVKLKML